MTGAVSVVRDVRKGGAKDGFPAGALHRGQESMSRKVSCETGTLLGKDDREPLEKGQTGLGAPVGSIVAGTAGFISRARKVRKMLGGGMRQAGVIAAAGIVALEQHVQRLEQDHANARLLAEGLAAVPGIEIDPTEVQTNIVNARLAVGAPSAGEFEVGMAARGVLFQAISEREVRMVTHLDVSRSDILWALEQISGFLVA